MNFYHPLERVPLVAQRHPFIVDLCKGKRVLHVGCVDSGLLQERYKHGELLHQKLLRVTEDLWGLDVDREGIEFLRQHGIGRLLLADLEKAVPECLSALPPFDVIVLSEVLEHVLNVGIFLENLKSLMTSEKTLLLLSVPNAYSIGSLVSMMKGVESVHPDHNYWFSHVTINTVLTKLGLCVRRELVYTFQENWLMFGARKKLVHYPLGEVKNSSANAQGVIVAIKRFLRTFPTRLIMSFLFEKSVYFGDGIIILCTKRNDG